MNTNEMDYFSGSTIDLTQPNIEQSTSRQVPGLGVYRAGLSPPAQLDILPSPTLTIPVPMLASQ